MNPDEKRSLIERYLLAYNNFDLDGMLTVLHPDIEFQNISRGKTNASIVGKEAFRQLAEQGKAVFTSRRQKIREYQSASPHEASIRVLFKGVVGMNLPNGLKKGAILEVEGRSEFQFKDGLIYRIKDIS